MRQRPLLLAAGSVASLLLAGCKVGPDYAAPEMPAPETWSQDASAVGVQADEPAVVRWWELLDDPVLDDLIARGVESNLDLRVAAARVREARAIRGIAAAAGLPEISANGLYDRSRESENLGGSRPGGGESTDLYQAGFDASWELDVFGGTARAVEAAEAQIEAVEAELRDVLVTLVSEVARNYVELRGFQRRLDLAMKNINVQTETLELSDARFRAGLVSELDVAQARAQLATTRAAVPQFATGIRQRVHALGLLLGTLPGALADELTPPAPIPLAPEALPVGLPSELLRRRPDVRQAERILAAETADIGVAVADLFPRFSLTGSFGLRADDFGELGDSDSRFWSIGPAVRWPLFQGGRIRANIRVQEAQQEQALALYERAVLNAFREVEDSLVAYLQQRERVESLAEAVEASQRAVELSERLYSSGLADFQRVLDSQGVLFAAEDALAEAQQVVAENLISLYKALGGGWEPILSPSEQAPAGETPDLAEPGAPAS